MRIYQVQPDDGNWSRYEIDGSHKWGLPGLQCVICGNTWTSVGLSYPSIDLSSLPNSERYFKKGAVSVEAMEELRQPLRGLIPPESLLKPGSSFGPLIGKAYGPIGDFAFCGSWTVLIRPGALRALQKADVQGLVGIPAQLKWIKRTPPVDLLELDLATHSRLASSSLPPEGIPTCSTCGYRKLKAPERIVLAQSSLPPDKDLFRGRDFTTYIFATSSFVEAVQKLRLTGLIFEEVGIAES